VTGRFFSPGRPVSSNKTDRNDIAEILLKVALNTTKQTNKRMLKHKINNATFNNISAISLRSVLLEETGRPGEKNRPVTSH
jgi:hypothetical protein